MKKAFIFSKLSLLSFLIPLIIGVGVVAKYLFTSGVPSTHDGENHVARIANFVAALKEGQWPPRFAPHLYQGYGYPVFNYNYPLLNILGTPFVAVGLSYPMVFKVLLVIMFVLGAGGWWYWLKTLDKPLFSRIAAITIWLSSPYVLSSWFVRGSIGEIAILALFPWVGAVATQSQPKKIPLWLAVLFITAFLLSHNVGVLLLTPVLWVLWVTHGTKDREWLFSWLLATGLTLWFWLPAIVEKSFVILDGAALSLTAGQHAVFLDQLIWSPVRKGFSFVGSLDTQSFQVGLQLLLGFFGVVILLILKKRHQFKNWLLVALFFLSVVLQLSFIAPLWTGLPLLSFIQFPWRLGLITLSVGALLLGTWWEDFPKWLKIGVVVLSGMYMVGAVRMVNMASWVQQPDLYYLQFPQTTSTAHENLPKTFTLETVPSWVPQPSVATGAAELVVTSWNGRKHTFEAIVKEPTLITEPTLAFPGWQTAISPLGLARTQVTRYDASSYSLNQSGGLIAYWLQPGSYSVETEFTQFTPSRLLGNGISLFTAVYIAFLMLSDVMKLKTRYLKKSSHV